MSLLAFTLVGELFTHAILRLQVYLPGNLDHLAKVPAGLSFNTAISFMTNTNWQNYTGEATLSQLSQMLGLVWHQFLSAAVGMALAAASIRCQRGEPTGSQRLREPLRDSERRVLRNLDTGLVPRWTSPQPTCPKPA